MAAAWSFSRGNHRPVTRLVSALSLDGHRLASEMQVRFTRALADDTAESIADEAARVASEVLSEQISQGKVPISRTEFVAMVETRTAMTVGKVAELRVAALYLVAEERQPHSTNRNRTAMVPPSTPVPVPAVTAPPPSKTGTSGQHVISIPSNVRTLWRVTLSGCHPGTELQKLGQLLGPPLRDSAAAIIFRAATTVDPATFDRMSLLEGKSVMVAQMQREAAACILAALFRVMTSNRIERDVIATVIEAAGTEALPDLPRAEIGRYSASESPVKDLASRLAATFEVPKDAPEIHQALLPYCEHLRNDLWHVAHEVQRLRSPAP
jgi:hypothetical protein